MANLIIQENGSARTRPAVNGEELTVRTPCDCSVVTGVQINGVVFPFYDAGGNSLSDIDTLFTQGSLIRVLIDTENTRAYILNANTSGYLESRLSFSTTATLPASWAANGAGFKQTVSVSGIRASDKPMIGLVQTSNLTTNATLREAWNMVSRIECSANKLTVYCDEKAPTVALPLQITCVR